MCQSGHMQGAVKSVGENKAVCSGADMGPWRWCIYEISEGHRSDSQLTTVLLSAIVLYLGISDCPVPVCKGTGGSILNSFPRISLYS